MAHGHRRFRHDDEERKKRQHPDAVLAEIGLEPGMIFTDREDRRFGRPYIRAGYQRRIYRAPARGSRAGGPGQHHGNCGERGGEYPLRGVRRYRLPRDSAARLQGRVRGPAQRPRHGQTFGPAHQPGLEEGSDADGPPGGDTLRRGHRVPADKRGGFSGGVHPGDGPVPLRDRGHAGTGLRCNGCASGFTLYLPYK
jgi:hypothetical protein